MTEKWTEEQIAALVDGALDNPDQAAALERLIKTDPEARACAKRIERMNGLMRASFDAPMREPAPQAIVDAIYSDDGPSWRRRAALWAPMAAAAALALAIGLGVGGLIDGGDPPQIALGDAPADGPLHQALETLPSGATGRDGVQPMLTFVDGRGRVCREFERLGETAEPLELGIACRSDTGRWRVEIVVAAPESAPGQADYRLASGPGPAALDTMLDALEAGAPLSPDAEAALLGAGWTSQSPAPPAAE